MRWLSSPVIGVLSMLGAVDSVAAANGFRLDSPPTTQSHEEASTGDEAVEQSSAGGEDLAKKLQNPVADLISVPFQSNFDFGGGTDLPGRPLPRFVRRLLPGPGFKLASRFLRFGQSDRDEAFRYTLNFQPVVPISVAPDWNVISRTILPLAYQDDVLGNGSQFGLGDTLQSFFLSPKVSKPIWGVGPVILLPTATDDSLGAERWGLGPTGVVLAQDGPWTYGLLANHLWSFAKGDHRKEINSTFLQPFLSYTFKTATTLTFNTEATYDWIDDQWTVPLYGGVSQIVKIGKLPVSLAFGPRLWVEGPDSAPDWSVRFAVTFLFPK